MHDPQENKFVPIPENMKPDDERHKWTRIQIGELVEYKGIRFRVHEIGETRMVLKLIK